MAPLSQIDQLVEAGLTSIRKLSYARIILSDIPTGIANMVYRDLTTQIFEKITHYILNDQILFQRLRQLLMNEHGLSQSAFEALVKKAEKSNIPLNIVLEIYHRGFEDEKNYPHLAPEQRAFNRINSFIAGGKARKIDRDLWEIVELDSHKREWGTTSLTDLYKEQTPGQSKTLKTIKKLVKK